MRIGIFAAGLLAVLAFSTGASADLVTFNSDPVGSKANGFTSIDSGIVHFSDTIGSGLNVNNFGGQSANSRALEVRSDGDGSKLRMDFDRNISALSLDFGNDDPAWSHPGEYAILDLYRGVNFVGRSVVVMNRDDIMNQTIAWNSAIFNTAFFYYGNANYQPYTGGGNKLVGLIEIVDNVRFTVPEPSLLALSGLGALVVAWRRRRRSA